MELDDFLSEVGKRTPRRDRKPLVSNAPVEEPVDEEFSADDNLFRAVSGMRFFCGVCHKTHNPKGDEKQDILKGCAERVKRQFGERFHRAYSHTAHSRYGKLFTRTSHRAYWGDHRPTSGGGVMFVPRNAAVPESIRFTFTRPPVLSGTEGNNESKFVRALHPSLFEERDKAVKRMKELDARTLSKEVLFREALGAKDTFAYLRDIQSKFYPQAEEEYDAIIKDQKDQTQDLLKRLSGVRRAKPEKFELTRLERMDETFVDREEVQPINRVSVNGSRLDAGDLLQPFNIVDAPVWRSKFGEWSEIRVYNVALHNGYPVLSWGYDLYKGQRRNTRKVNARIAFVSTWHGRVYLNTASGYYNALNVNLKDVSWSNLIGIHIKGDRDPE